MRCNMSKLLNIMIIITICVCLNSCCTKAAKERKSGDVYSHTIQLSSLSPSSTSCVRSSKASNTKSSLEVVHRHGPCSSLSSGKAIDHAEILRHDQDRVNSIYSKLSKRFEDPVTQTQATVLPALDGSLLKFVNYFVTVGVGTPRHNLSLVFDTGSDLTWTQCEPCDVGNCYSQTEPIFNPSSSSSYSNLSCSSSDCDDLITSQGIKRVCSSLTSTCGYRTEYGDSSTTSGFLATEKFTLTNTDVIDGVKFGCGKNNKGLFKGIAGLLGLGRGKFSFPSQTKMTYKNIFSYCIPSSPNNIGHLTFGSSRISNAVKYTPIRSLSETFYVIDMEGIIVDNKRLQIPSNVAVIDSGTVITRLPPKSYAALRTAFKEYMSKSNYTITNGDGFLDTCYDFTGVNTVNVPRISFSLGGGTVVELDQKGILYQIGESQYCLGFAANGNDNSPILFGNVQQKRLDVVYDGLNGRIGFAPNGCN